MTERPWIKSAAELAEALAATEATPGGGSAAAAAGAFGCGLGRMAAGITLGGKNVEEARREGLGRLLRELEGDSAGFLRLAAEDAEAFEAVMAALKLPKAEPGRAERLERALQGAAEVPLKTAAAAAEALESVLRGASLASPYVASDMACAAHLLRAAALCALENVAVNLGPMKDAGAAASLKARAEALRRRVQGA